MGELYRLDFPGGKSYVGVTRHTAQRRFVDHRRAAKNSAKGIVYHVWRRDGEPRLVVLAIVEDADLYETERRAVLTYGTRFPAGYNMTDGGDVPPSLSPEVAAKIASKLKGRVLSDARRAAQALAMTGRKASAAARANMSRAQKGKVLSDGHRAKLSAAKLGTSRSIEIRAKMSASQRARRMSEGCTPQRWRYP